RGRSLDSIYEAVAHDEVGPRLRDGRIVAVVPSRPGGFGLAAVEALMQGCPTIVGAGCGACDFLDTAYPGLPYLKLDPGDAMASHEAIVTLLADYDAARRGLRAYLAQARRQEYGSDLHQIYATASTSDPAPRRIV